MTVGCTIIVPLMTRGLQSLYGMLKATMMNVVKNP